MLATPAAVEEVIFGGDGAAHGFRDGATLIEMSTIGPDALEDIRRRLPANVALVDAPVLGSVPEAEEGRLQVFLGGAPEDLERFKDVFETLGAVKHVGPLGAGAAMKIVVNSTLSAVVAAAGEALALADHLDLPERAVLDVLELSAVGQTIGKKRSFIETDAYPANFKLSLAVKDMSLVTATADTRQVEVRLAEAARSWFEEADAASLGDADYSALIAHIRGRPARP